MVCPLCNVKLEQALVANTEVDYCKRCYGLWFEEDELQQAKDEKDKDLRWLDIDLWKDEAHFRLRKGTKRCPFDNLPLYEAQYGDSGTKVDVCNICQGIWLDRGEFKNIIAYLKEKEDCEILHHYLSNFSKEFWEIFSGPELLKEEIIDFLTILKLLRYKFAVQHPVISQLITSIPR